MYSDRDLIVATQIAYYNFSPEILKNDYSNITLRELLLTDSYVIDKLYEKLDKAKEKGHSLKIERAENAINLYNEIVSIGSKYGKWIMKDIGDDNVNSGFYSCLIETSMDSAIIAFRGSESEEQFAKDWIGADMGLIRTSLTRQQAMASLYMEYIHYYYGYKNYATTGHSLGGNLSVHAAITAPFNLQRSISQVMNYDGPGFSEEYLQDIAYSQGIKDMGEKIIHYQWSMVGALLYQIPDSLYLPVLTVKEIYQRHDLDSLIQRHDTSFVRYDDNGMLIPADMDGFARYIGKFSRRFNLLGRKILERAIPYEQKGANP